MHWNSMPLLQRPSFITSTYKIHSATFMACCVGGAVSAFTQGTEGGLSVLSCDLKVRDEEMVSHK